MLLEDDIRQIAIEMKLKVTGLPLWQHFLAIAELVDMLASVQEKSCEPVSFYRLHRLEMQ